MTVLALVAVASYLLGGIPFSYIAGRALRGLDLREHGSGNLGATNAYRILGAGPGIVVLLLDVAKGFVPVVVAGRFEAAPPVADHWLPIAAMFFSILGHLFSPYLRFRGGKGIATAGGAFAALAPWAFLGAVVVFAVVVSARRIVSLASISASVLIPVFVLVAGRMGRVDEYLLVFAASVPIMALVVVKHGSNIRRLRAGTEDALARTEEP